MYVSNFSRPDQVEIFKFVEARPEVVEIEHGRDIRMRRGTRHLKQRWQRGDERRCAQEFNPERHVELLRNFPRVTYVVYSGFVVIRGDLLSGGGGSVDAVQAKCRKHLAPLLEILERRGTTWIWLP